VVALAASGAVHGLAFSTLSTASQFGVERGIPSWFHAPAFGWIFAILFPAVAIAHEYGVRRMRGSAILLALLAAALDLVVLPTAPAAGGISLLLAATVLFRVLSEDEGKSKTQEAPPVAGPLHRALLAVTSVTALINDGYQVHLGLSGEILLATLAVILLGFGVRDDLNQRAQNSWQEQLIFLARIGALCLIPVWGVQHTASLIVLPELAKFGHQSWKGDFGKYVRSELFRNPPLLLIVSFGAVILLGTLFLGLPASSSTGNPIGLLSAFFTSTSATCVTGLVVLDTGTEFSTFGQTIILILIQIGGLGIVTISAFVAILIGARIGVRQTWAISDLTDQPGPQHMRQLVRFVVICTLSIELVGAVLLFVGGTQQGMAPLDAAWFSVFHSISAFCNAGFSLQTDSLVGFAGDPLIMNTVSILVILGGIGFIPLSMIAGRFLGKQNRFGSHTKVALAGTAAMLVAGAVLFWLLESPVSAVDQQKPGMNFWDAGFHSVSLRTAGFNAVPMNDLAEPSVLLSMAFMFVGGCPGGTAGGIKVTTLIVLLFSVRSLLRDETHVEIADRAVPERTVVRALVVVVISVGVIFLGWLVLLATQTGIPMDRLGFEAVSAYATVGLSLDTTTQLDATGRLIIIAMMFAGRVGPLAIVFGIGSPRRTRIRPAVEDIHVG